MKRTVVPELIDCPKSTRREAVDSLTDMQMFNRRFGGVRSMAALLRRVALQRRLKSLTWLDVAGALGGLVNHTSMAVVKKGIEVKPVVLDRVVTHLASHNASVCADALHLPFRDNSFDVVGSCLFLHHLEPEQVVMFVAESLRVARHAVLINDLIRHPLHLAIAQAGIPIYRSRLTRHDAPASVRRAYTIKEIRSLLGGSNAFKLEIDSYYLFRMGVIAWKSPDTA